MANHFVTLFVVVGIVTILEAYNGPMVNLRAVKNQDVAGIKKPSKGPTLMYCSGKFKRMEYEMFCMVPENYTIAMWDMDHVPLPNNTKYMQIPGLLGNKQTLTLKIMDLDERDQGVYTLNIAGNGVTVQEVFYLTDMEACGSSMHCFENPCKWPKPLTCADKPDAHCVVNMCMGGMGDMCQPFWYEGLEQVNCTKATEEMK